MDAEQLEQYIDEIGLVAVLEEIDEICQEKAEHITSSYGDGDAGKWEKAGNIVDDCSTEIYKLDRVLFAGVP